MSNGTALISVIVNRSVQLSDFQKEASANKLAIAAERQKTRQKTRERGREREKTDREREKERERERREKERKRERERELTWHSVLVRRPGPCR